ncbi:hypothetical protein LOZ80_13910 [Paenibacillus sp. HWE-109]|uniref:WD40/YVTN/BNR-like repeat-containing protein n=1 Tax=Paenibacillus sp. HWE-109 TaxID=1306526 RepID=UPI001EDFCB54|nr:hypothetical protein [Paenibacillus sp. HWE-109]UKS29966.1 hypothetical protein LOZ80_13910 [Paenibacillus sp. HWE-109]
MLALMNNKIFVLFIILLLCAGCLYEKTSTTAPNLRTPLQANFGAMLTIGEPIRVDTQSDPPQLIPSRALTFIDELRGYGLADNGKELQLIQTSDGGVTWQAKNKITNQTAPSTISFLDTETGWLFAKERGTNKSELRLTSDGGQSWEVIAQNLPGLEGTQGTPYFQFFDRQKGLLAAQSYTDLQLLRTQDGGLTWSVSNRIPLPAKAAGAFTFQSQTTGWFIGPGSGKREKDRLTLYQMKDGETWLETSKLPNSGNPVAIAFADAQHGYILIEMRTQSTEQEIRWQWLRTVDGGKTWSQHAFPSTFQPLEASVQMSFATATSGWLRDTKDIWRTTDEGLNWSLVTP